MDKIMIPHADNAFVDRSEAPFEYLIVATGLPEHQIGSQPEAGAKQEMMNAIAHKVAELGLQGYKVHWADSAKNDDVRPDFAPGGTQTYVPVRPRRNTKVPR
jgi:hypothetical protein